MRKTIGTAVGVGLVLGLWMSIHSEIAIGADPVKGTPDQGALERTRAQVKMLDDIYKTAVVLITETYVHEEGDVAAATAAKALFKAVDAKGYHQVRIIDATGNPYDADNVPKGNFEINAMKKIKQGAPQVESIEGNGGDSFLRVMTPIPVVMEKCTMCHPHYKDVPAGQAIGALSYRVPIR